MRSIVSRLALCLALVPFAAAAQSAKPYKPVVVTYDRAAESAAALAAFVKQAGAAVQAKDAAALAPLLSEKFVALDCPANPLKACAPGKAKAVDKGGKPIARLRLAMCCAGKPAPDMP